MFLGHYALAFGAKRIAPAVSLGTLFLACQFADLLWPTLVVMGIEIVEVDPGNTLVTPLNFVKYPYSHSLVMLLVWSVVFGLLYLAFRAGLNLREVPVRWDHNEGSKVSVVSDSFKMLNEVGLIRQQARRGVYDSAIRAVHELKARWAVDVNSVASLPAILSSRIRSSTKSRKTTTKQFRRLPATTPATSITKKRPRRPSRECFPRSTPIPLTFLTANLTS